MLCLDMRVDDSSEEKRRRRDAGGREAEEQETAGIEIVLVAEGEMVRLLARQPLLLAAREARAKR